jgi:peptide/nickel transport system ATP-binding protein
MTDTSTTVATASAPAPAALAVNDLNVVYTVRGVDRAVLRGVSFEVAPGEAFGLVGESGCGKSTTAYAALRYLPRNGKIVSGSVRVAGREVTAMSESELRDFRGREASMVYQDPGQAMNPTIRVGKQLRECFTLLGQSKAQAAESAIAALRRVQIADPSRVMDRYPFQLSGGMQQRVVIAMALASDPSLLVLDEPTTGLDATVEAEVLDLVKQLRQETGAAVLMIAHNLGIIRDMCDRVGVMYAGRVVEQGPAGELFDNPMHPYTVGLLRSLPRHGISKRDQQLVTIPGALPLIGTDLPTCVFVDRCPLADDTCRTEVPPVREISATRWTRCHYPERISELSDSAAAVDIAMLAPVSGDRDLLELTHISKTFRQRGQAIPAVVDVDLTLHEGETLGVVGESGSGKTTLAKTLLGIETYDVGGGLALQGRNVNGNTSARSAEQKRSMQMVFQNPDSALNRAWTVRRILVRSVRRLTGVSQQEANERVEQLAAHLRLTPRHLDLKPRQLSGGLKQRVAIARAFAGDPRIVVCDEPTSALDVSVQAAILNLLAELQSEQRTGYVFISHDMGVVRYLADRIAVMYLGRIQEIAPTDALFAGPNHPYTEALLSAIPSVDGELRSRIKLEGEIPSPANPPSGCVFHPRCHRVIEGLCAAEVPPLVDAGGGHMIRCHIPPDELAALQATPVQVSAGPATA